MSIRYRKTDLGIVEVATRAHRLVPRLRQALIVVDGRKTEDELRPLLGAAAEETLRLLMDQGFIVASVIADPPVQRQQERQQALATGTSLDALDLATNLAHVRREAVRMLTQWLGPSAEGLAIRIERAKTAAELRPLLEIGAQAIRSARGAAPADEFAARFLAPP